MAISHNSCKFFLPQEAEMWVRVTISQHKEQPPLHIDSVEGQQEVSSSKAGTHKTRDTSIDCKDSSNELH